jgi:hypothetical protein
LASQKTTLTSGMPLLWAMALCIADGLASEQLAFTAWLQSRSQQAQLPG